MKNIYEHNKVINEIITEVDNLLNEKKVLNEWIGLGIKILGPKTVNWLLRNGGAEYVKRKMKEKADQLGGAIEAEVNDLFRKPNLTKSGEYDYDSTVKEIDSIHARIREKLSTLPSDYGSTTSTNIINPYSKIGLKFVDRFELIVSPGGEPITKTFNAGTYEEFRVITEKKTSNGYITKLYTDNFENHLELLFYTSERIKTGPNKRCSLQLIYDGSYTGNRVEGDIKIVMLK